MALQHFDPRAHAPDKAFLLSHDVGINERQLRRIWGEVIGQARCDSAQWAERGIISKALAEQMPALPRLRVEQTCRSEIDAFEKLVFRTADGLAVESVIIPLHKEGKVSLCLSSQVGCVMGCVFCATARISKRRNLESWEIVDQFVQCRALAQASGRAVTGVVFMGMGEPFLNYERVIAAAQLFSYPTGGSISAEAITVSTVGLVPEINRFAQENHRFRLSISLGAATDAKRAKLVPIAARTPVRSVMAAARNYAHARRDRVNLAYVCIAGENVFEEDARALGHLIGDTPVRLDLIDVRDSTGRYLPPTSSELAVFRDALRQYVGQPVARRYSGGADINAACGTLAAQ